MMSKQVGEAECEGRQRTSQATDQVRLMKVRLMKKARILA